MSFHTCCSRVGAATILGSPLDKTVPGRRSQPYRYRLGSLLLTPLNGPGERLVRSISPVPAQNATNKPVAMSRSWNRSRTAPYQNPLPFVATADLLSSPVPCRTGNAHPLCRRLG